MSEHDVISETIPATEAVDIVGPADVERPGSDGAASAAPASATHLVEVVPGHEVPSAAPVMVPPSILQPAMQPAHAQRRGPWTRMWDELMSGAQTLVSAAVYATLIVTFGFQVARVDGLSMAPTLEDHDRLIVNKLVYELGDPRPGDIVMLYYPLN